MSEVEPVVQEVDPPRAEQAETNEAHDETVPDWQTHEAVQA